MNVGGGGQETPDKVPPSTQELPRPPTDRQMVEQHLQPLWAESRRASRCPHTSGSPALSNLSVVIGRMYLVRLAVNRRSRRCFPSLRRNCATLFTPERQTAGGLALQSRQREKKKMKPLIVLDTRRV